MDTNFCIILCFISILCFLLTFLLVRLKEGYYTVVKRDEINRDGKYSLRIIYKNGRIKTRKL